MGMLSSILKTAAPIAGGMFGGPVGSAIGGALAGAVGGTGGTPRDPAALPAPFKGLTMEQLMGAINQYNQYLDRQNIYNQTPTRVGQASATQNYDLSPQQIKAEAYIQHRIQQGDTPQQAQQAANAILAKGKGFRSDKGFRQAIKQGNFQGLSVRDGKVYAQPKMASGGIDFGAGQEQQAAALNNLNLQSFGAASGLPALYSMNERRALGLREGLTNPLLNMAFNKNQNGLTPDTQSAIDDINAEYKRQFGNLLNQGLQEATGELYNSGFTSSSQAGDVMDKFLGKAATRFASEAAGNMATKYSDMLTQGAGRDAQALQGALSTYQNVATPSGINSVLGNIMAPTQFGGLSDAQAAQLAANMQQTGYLNRQRDQMGLSDLMTKETTIFPNMGNPVSGGFMAGLPSLISGLRPYAAQGIQAVRNRMNTRVA